MIIVHCPWGTLSVIVKVIKWLEHISVVKTGYLSNIWPIWKGVFA
ncbi:hypothetical protein SAMN05421724_2644 [Pseudomonas syringae]|nr:hypothetical protein SAMN05421724_2644 [Pseudomonas syringae]